MPPWTSNSAGPVPALTKPNDVTVDSYDRPS